MLDVATMFLNAHGGVYAFEKALREGRRAQVPLGYYQLLGMSNALAWVLGVDLDQMDAPKVAGEIEPPEEVQATWIDAYGCYFVEFPPDEMQAKQQYRAEFLSPKQALELLDELRLHVLNRAHLMPAEYEEVVRRDRAARKARKQALALASASAPVQLRPRVRAARSAPPADVGEDGELPEGA